MTLCVTDTCGAGGQWLKAMSPSSMTMPTMSTWDNIYPGGQQRAAPSQQAASMASMMGSQGERSCEPMGAGSQTYACEPRGAGSQTYTCEPRGAGSQTYACKPRGAGSQTYACEPGREPNVRL